MQLKECMQVSEMGFGAYSSTFSQSIRLHHAGVFNISNKLFVSLDILFDMRSHVKQGESPGNCAHAVLESTWLSGNKLNLSQSELRYLEQKLYDGYFAFEAVTHRDWNAGICGVCGIAPVFESGDGNCKNYTPLKKGQVWCVGKRCETLKWYLIFLQCVWPDSISYHFTGVVDIDGWWKALEENIVEASVFTAAKPMPIEAHTIAPWIPPIARASTVINTELWKGTFPLLLRKHISYLTACSLWICRLQPASRTYGKQASWLSQATGWTSSVWKVRPCKNQTNDSVRA